MKRLPTLFILLILTACAATPTPSPSPASTTTVTPSPTATLTPTVTLTPANTATVTPTPRYVAPPGLNRVMGLPPQEQLPDWVAGSSMTLNYRQTVLILASPAARESPFMMP